MKRFHTLILVLALSATQLPRAGFAAQADHADDTSMTFAVCAGRFHAARGYEWTAPGQRVDSTTASLSFAELLLAVGLTGDNRSPSAKELRDARVQAHVETANLVLIAKAGPDPRRAQRAAQTLAQRLRACDGLLP